MLLILILASLAAVYRIAHLAAPVEKREIHPPEAKASGLEAKPVADALLTPGLAALGRALDQYTQYGRRTPKSHCFRVLE